MDAPSGMEDMFKTVVVYLDEAAHRSEGKILVTEKEALEKYPDHLGAEYICVGLGWTWRYLQVGDKRFWLEYRSNDSWRSNYGDVKIEVLSQEKDGFHPRFEYPLFAVDFIPDIPGEGFVACDFNIAPEIRGTGVENILPAKEAADAIKRAITLGRTVARVPQGSVGFAT